MPNSYVIHLLILQLFSQHLSLTLESISLNILSITFALFLFCYGLLSKSASNTSIELIHPDQSLSAQF